MEPPFTHLDDHGHVRMVDVSDKEPTRRSAVASCLVHSTHDVFALPGGPSGLEPVVAARLAGIQAAKRTSQLIPLCHPINLSDVDVEVTSGPEGTIVRATVVTVNRTGVEMEALTACAFAALSLLDALRSADPRASYDTLALDVKTGGRSGDWGRQVGIAAAAAPDGDVAPSSGAKNDAS